MLKISVGVVALPLVACGSDFTAAMSDAAGGAAGTSGMSGSAGTTSAGGAKAPVSSSHAGGVSSSGGSSLGGSSTVGGASPSGGSPGAGGVVGPTSTDAGAAPQDAGSDGACGDTKSDPQNCGSCAHSCERGLCQNGACQAYVLAAAVLPSAVALSGSYVYFTTSDDSTGRVARVPKTGGAAEPLAQNQLMPVSVAVDDTSVFWVDEKGNDVAYCSQRSCSPTDISTGLVTVTSVSVDSSRVYFTSGGAAGTGIVSGRLKPNGTEAFALSDRSYVTGGVSVGSHFCWTEHDPATFAGLLACVDAADGTNLVSLSTPLPGIPATDGTRVYWTIGSGAVLGSEVPPTGSYSNLTGNPPDTQGGRGAVAVSIFDGSLYLAYSKYPTKETGIAVCPTGGCFRDGEVVVSTDTTPLSAVGVDSSGIYWAAQGRGIMKLVH